MLVIYSHSLMRAVLRTLHKRAWVAILAFLDNVYLRGTTSIRQIVGNVRMKYYGSGESAVAYTRWVYTLKRSLILLRDIPDISTI